MTRILGLDISKASVSACVLAEKPEDPREAYYEVKFHHFTATKEGIQSLLALDFDIAIFEPTGTNYSRIWQEHLSRSGKEIRLIGHRELRGYRKDTCQLPNKDDDADALAMACYGFDYLKSPRRFVEIREYPVWRMRELVLRLQHLNRIQNPIINRVRQDLAWQFPEIALRRSQRYSDEPPIMWAWLAGERPSKKYDELYAASCGLGLSPTVIEHAKRICSLQREEVMIEKELRSHLSDPKFAPYREVFKKFGFGQRIEALILSQIYPIEKYFGPDGKPQIVIKRGRNSGKPTKRYLSRRRFEKALGCAPTENSSGDMESKRIRSGSALCRRALWQWVFCRINVKKCRPKNEIGKILGDRLDLEKSGGKPIRLVRQRIASRTARMLFNELVKTLH